jgi:hypothetical protein
LVLRLRGGLHTWLWKVIFISDFVPMLIRNNTIHKMHVQYLQEHSCCRTNKQKQWGAN